MFNQCVVLSCSYAAVLLVAVVSRWCAEAEKGERAKGRRREGGRGEERERRGDNKERRGGASQNGPLTHIQTRFSSPSLSLLPCASVSVAASFSVCSRLRTSPLLFSSSPLSTLLFSSCLSRAPVVCVCRVRCVAYHALTSVRWCGGECECGCEKGTVASPSLSLSLPCCFQSNAARHVTTFIHSTTQYEHSNRHAGARTCVRAAAGGGGGLGGARSGGERDARRNHCSLSSLSPHFSTTQQRQTTHNEATGHASTERTSSKHE